MKLWARFDPTRLARLAEVDLVNKCSPSSYWADLVQSGWEVAVVVAGARGELWA